MTPSPTWKAPRQSGSRLCIALTMTSLPKTSFGSGFAPIMKRMTKNYPYSMVLGCFSLSGATTTTDVVHNGDQFVLDENISEIERVFQ